MFNWTESPDVWDIKHAINVRCFTLGYGEPYHDWVFLALDGRELHRVDPIEPGYVIMGKWGEYRVFRIALDSSFGWYWSEIKF